MTEGGDYIEWPSNTAKGFMEAYEGDGLVMSRPNKARGTVQSQTAPTLTCGTGGGSGTVTDHSATQEDSGKLRIRSLTERECLRLMGQSDDAIDRIFAVEPSKTQRYKAAGNSIVVDVLVAIFKGIYIDESFVKPQPKQKGLEDFL